MGNTPSYSEEELVIPDFGDKRERTVSIKYGFDKDLYRNSDPPPSPLPWNNAQENNFEIFGSLSKLSEKEPIQNDTGTIPSPVMLNVLYFSDLKSLVSIALSCKQFFSIFNSRTFWREYYHDYFNILNQHNMEEDLNITDLKWKKLFFEKLSEERKYTDSFFRKKYRIVSKEQLSEDFDKTQIAKKFELTGHILVLGESEVGKTCFLERLLNNSYSHTYPRNIHQATGMKERKVTLVYETRESKVGCFDVSIWEIGGSTDNFRLVDLKMKECCGLFLCVSFDNAKSVITAKKILKNYESYGKSIHGVILVVLKSDLTMPEYNTEVDDMMFLDNMNDVQNKIRKFHRKSKIVHFVESSSRHDLNAFKAFGLMMDSVLGRMRASSGGKE